ncbi:Putative intracellular protease/amidase [Paraburkholderia fungorum]|uniref:Putative intracellular protease/amidase n=1 Tax=Paraburkholderia fungorum TaxID=134537 RepID=A0A1H1JW76_9BURK|nr:type 1 glutamine amidotransferase domain-containing protein [Paraburkholderia fungorum]SDR53817.1 Putative intracellular protease/amidase [Paraburkholderia fungorum]
MTILIVLTSHDTLGDTGKKTGLWLEEFLAPFYEFTDANIPVRLATPAGGIAPIDPLSIEMIESTDLYRRFANDASLVKLLQNTEQLEKIDAQEVDGVLYPGGHGPLFDLRTNPHSIRLIESLFRTGKPVATICHAGCVLLDAKATSGAPLVNGKNLTAFSDSEEVAAQLAEVVPYLVETELKKLGANYSRAPDWNEYIVRDGQLLSGQNPASSRGVAKALIEVLGIKV